MSNSKDILIEKYVNEINYELQGCFYSENQEVKKQLNYIISDLLAATADNDKEIFEKFKSLVFDKGILEKDFPFLKQVIKIKVTRDIDEDWVSSPINMFYGKINNLRRELIKMNIPPDSEKEVLRVHRILDTKIPELITQYKGKIFPHLIFDHYSSNSFKTLSEVYDQIVIEDFQAIEYVFIQNFMDEMNNYFMNNDDKWFTDLGEVFNDLQKRIKEFFKKVGFQFYEDQVISFFTLICLNFVHSMHRNPEFKDFIIKHSKPKKRWF